MFNEQALRCAQHPTAFGVGTVYPGAPESTSQSSVEIFIREWLRAFELKKTIS
jgi:hypothetical protein